MRTIILTLLLTILFAGSPAHSQDSQETEYVPGVILVQFSRQALPDVSQTISSQEIQDIEAVSALREAGIDGGTKLFKKFMPPDTMATFRTGEKVRLVNLSRWYKLTVDTNVDIPRMANRLEKAPGIVSASPDYLIRLQDTFPDDPEFDQDDQWGLYNFDTPGNDIHAPAAWDKNKGRSDVVVGIIDSGVDYNHPDLDPGDRSRVIQGYDFANDDSDPMDDAPAGDHGTGVAGAVGAITNNNSKVAGVMWNVKLMPLKAAKSSDTQGVLSTSAAAQAVEYARNNGADIVNMSFGSPPCNGVICSFSGYPLSGPLLNAYLEGLILTGSTGNTGQKELRYPSGLPTVMAVGESNEDDSRDASSTYGKHVDFVAPGGFQSTSRYNDIQFFGGTSHAAPIASGVAGLILSESRDLGLGLTNDDIRHLMQKTAKDLGPSGQDDEYGHGRLNANAALQALQPPNDVIHASHTGGTGQKMYDDVQQVFYDNGRPTGLAAGTYIADVHEVTGHVNFSTYFQDPPMVWIRERSTRGWSGANPNNEWPWVEITNVTKSGFDYKTFVYYVESTVNGQVVGWKPTSPSNVEIAYTAVGDPDTPPLDVTLSGPNWLDNGEQGTWTASVSGGAGSPSYNWERMPPGASSWYSAGCSGASCSHTFYNYGSSQIEKAHIRVTVTKGSEQDQVPASVNIYPAGGYPSLAKKSRGIAVRGLDARTDGGGAAEVKWSTRASFPSSAFVVQHRADSSSAWSQVGRVPASDSVGADTSRGASYRFRVEDLSVGPHQFRLRFEPEEAAGPLTSRVISAEIRLTEAYELSAYPNPLRGRGTIELAVREAQEVTVQVYDVLGRRITTLHEGRLPGQETRRFRLNASEANLSSGTYFVRVRGDAFRSTRRLTVVR